MSKIFKNGRVVAGSNYYKDLLDKPTINGHALEEINNTSKSLEIFQAVTKTDFEDPSFVRNPQCVYAVFEEDSLGRTNVRFHFSNQLEATDPDYKEYIANDYKPVTELPDEDEALKEQIYFLTEGWIDPVTNLKYGIGLYGWMIIDDTTTPPTYGWRALTEVPIDERTIFMSEDGNISSQVGGYHDTNPITLKTQSTELIRKETATNIVQDDDYTYITIPYTEGLYEQYTPRTQYTTSLFYQGAIVPTSKSVIPTNLMGDDYIKFNHDKTVTITLDKTSYSSSIPADYIVSLAWDKPLEESISYINPVYFPVDDSITVKDGKMGVASAKNAYNSIHKIDDYLYEVDYPGVNYFEANEYFKELNPSVASCASFRNGLYFGYNHDSVYNEEASFVVYTPSRTSRHASMGIATGISELTKEFVESGKYSKLYSVVPFMVKDGVNDKGLSVSIHTVPIIPGATPTEVTVPDVEEEKRFCALQLGRYALDRFESAKEAAEYIRDYVAVYMPKNFQDEGYEVSVIVADTNKIYSIEFIDNKNEIREISSSPIYTNFYKSLTTLNTDGTVYTPKDVPTHTPTVENTLKANSQGLERFNILTGDYDPAGTFTSPIQMRTSLNKINYTKIYNLANELYTDYSGLGTLTVDSPTTDYTSSADVANLIAKFAARSRDPEDPNYGTKHTSHSSIYDMKAKKLYLINQEGSVNYEFILPLEESDDEDYILGPISDTSIDSSQNTVLQQILNDIFNSNKTLIINYNNEDHLMTSNEEKEDDSGRFLSFATVLNRSYTMIKVYYNDSDKSVIGARRHKVYPIQYSLTDVGEGTFLPTGNIIAVCDDYRRITATAFGAFKVSLVNGWCGDGTVEYSFDRENWTTWDGVSTIEVTSVNPYNLYEVNFRGVGNTYISTDVNQTQFKFTTMNGSETDDINLEIRNNPTYLLDYNTTTVLDTTDLFNSLFKDCKLISKASAIILPYVSIGVRSYKDMFSGCTMLKSGPVVPAETLEEESCSGMFRNCIKLSVAPALAPTTLAKACYKEMFMGCSSLVFPDQATAPYTLPADKLAESCYESMFKGCESITYAPSLEGGVAFGVPDYAYANMFENCTSLIIGSKELSAITIGDHSYENMFKGCKAMTTAMDEIHATSLGEYAMTSMFEGCEALVKHPKIEATLLRPYTCQAMFKGCKALEDPEYFPKFSVLDDHSCTQMYMNCITLTKPIAFAEDVICNGTEPITDQMYQDCAKIIWYNAGEPYKITIPDNRFDNMFTGNGYKHTVSEIPSTNTMIYYTKPDIDNCIIVKPADMTNSAAFNISFNVGFVKKDNLPHTAGHLMYALLPATEPEWKDLTTDTISVGADKYLALSLNIKNTNGIRLFRTVGTDIKLEGNLSGGICVPEKYSNPESYFGDYTLEGLFADCQQLTTAVNLKYVEKFARKGMYKYLFNNSSVITAPSEEFKWSEIEEAYSGMFKDCNALINISKFKENTNIGKRSCAEMFMNTTALTTVPFNSIGKDNVGEEGCISMFEGSGLTSVLRTPSTYLSKGCYKRMFAESSVSSFLANSKVCSYIKDIPEEACMEMFTNCLQLTVTPDDYLDEATTCDKYGCMSMFKGCSALVRAIKIKFDDIKEHGCDGMFKNCTSLENVTTSYSFNSVAEKGCFEMYFNTKIINSPEINILDVSGDLTLGYIFSECSELKTAGNITITSNEDTNVLSHAFYKCSKLEDAPIITNTEATEGCYTYMFAECPLLKTCPALPLSTVGKNSYSYMFNNCTTITAPPELPATELGEYCYDNMFSGCTGLTYSSDLIAEVVPAYAYQQMYLGCNEILSAGVFGAKEVGAYGMNEMYRGCNKITIAPELESIAKVGESSLYQMFYQCYSLEEIPSFPSATEMRNKTLSRAFYQCTALKDIPHELPATILGTNCYEEMFYSCTNLTYPINLPALNMATYCYTKMFYNCSGITWTPTGKTYRLPTTGSGSTASYWSDNMFTNNGGSSVPSTPSINTNYYYSEPIVLTFENSNSNATDVCVKNTVGYAIQYSFDGTNWETLANGATTPVGGSNKVLIRGGISSSFDYTQASNKGLYVTGTDVKVSGTLTKGASYAGLFAYSPGLKDASGLIMSEEGGMSYRGMFYECTALTTSPTILPAMNLASLCYMEMFRGCTSLTSAPELPATELDERCYELMFYQCTSLVTAPPELPATNLKSRCYYQMFKSCSSLMQVPVISATTMAYYCCFEMFGWCSSLTEAPALPATNLSSGDHCYDGMFNSCVQLETPPELPATTLSAGCYQGLFRNTAISRPPELNATVLPAYCYLDMFRECRFMVFADRWASRDGNTEYAMKHKYCVSRNYTSAGTDCVYNMFLDCKHTGCGGQPATPTINSYYLIVPNTKITVTSNDTTPIEITNKYNYPIKYRENASDAHFKEIAVGATVNTGVTEIIINCPMGTIEPGYGDMNKVTLYLAINTPCKVSGKLNPAQVYGAMFANSTGITDASGIIFPQASECEEGDLYAHNVAYRAMFMNCTNLITPPEKIECVSAAFYGFQETFRGCTNLTTPPELLNVKYGGNNYAYRGMFMDCENMVGDMSAKIDLSNYTASIGEYEFANMFYNCKKITKPIKPPKGDYYDPNCYLRKCGCSSMYYCCTSLTDMMEMPYRLIYAEGCYRMYKGCESLVNIKEFNPNLYYVYAYGCDEMFSDCKSLITAPQLPAMSLGDYCYRSMFNGCTSLKTAPYLPAEAIPQYGYCAMFYKCTSLEYPPTFGCSVGGSVGYCALINMFNGSGIKVPPYIPARNWSGYVAQLACQDCKNIYFSNSGIPYSIPSERGGSAGDYCFEDMFYGCSGTNVPRTPVINTIYYYRAPDSITLKFETAAGNVSITSHNGIALEYSSDNTNWAAFNDGATINSSSVYWVRGYISNRQTISLSPILDVSGTGVKVSGVLGENSDYACLFYGCTNGIADASGLIFPEKVAKNYKYMFYKNPITVPPVLRSERVTSSSYQNMFGKCTSLTTAPELPATILADHCYDYMFEGCTSLTTPPTALPATTLEYMCYHAMFDSCTSLTTAPEILATKMNTRGCCCYNMFVGCTALTTPPKLLTEKLTDYCYQWMFKGCTSLKIAPEILANRYTYQSCSGMFEGCTSLILPPVLHFYDDQSLGQACFATMFYGCTSLAAIPALPCRFLYQSCYQYMFYGCTSLKFVGSGRTRFYLRSNQYDTNNCTVYDNATYYMFGACSGSYTTTPSSDTSYYYISQIDTTLTFACKDSSKSDLTIKNRLGHDILYSTNGGTTWNTFANTSTIGPFNNVMIKGVLGTDTTPTLAIETNAGLKIEGTDVKVTGKLLDGIGYTYLFNGAGLTDASGLVFPTADKLNGANYEGLFCGCTGLTKVPQLPIHNDDYPELPYRYIYYYMFAYCTSLVEVPENLLTASKVGYGCYDHMFYQCTSLISPPKLPAMQLAPHSYCRMFESCTSLKDAPELPATDLTNCNDCYYSTFNTCTSLEVAPALPATKLSPWCYESTFYHCTSLREPPELPAEFTSADYCCYYHLFNGCTSLTKPVLLPTKALGDRNYAGMFYCTGITWSDSGVPYRIPTTGSGSAASNSMTDMFYGNRTISASPNPVPTPGINTTYYYIPETTLELIDTSATNANSQMVLTNGLSYPIEFMRDDNGTWQTLAAGSDTSLETIINKLTIRGILIGDSSHSVKVGVKDGGTATVKVKGDLHDHTPYKYLFAGSTALTDASELTFPENVGRYDYMFQNCTGLITAPTILPATQLRDFCYEYMFSGCTALTTPPTLPATTLAYACYYYMFYSCTSLTTAPTLPATTLAESCYNHMFQNCTALTTAPELPATKTANYCYYYMFSDCSSLTKPPQLPAKSIYAYCYNSMFKNCTSLTTAPELPATSLHDYCYEYMFHNCTSLKLAPELPATGLGSYCYRGMFLHCTSLEHGPSKLPALYIYVESYNSMFAGCTSLKEIVPFANNMYLYNYCFYRMYADCTQFYWGIGKPFYISVSSTPGSYYTNGMFANNSGSYPDTPSINTTYYYTGETTLTFTSASGDFDLTNNLGNVIKYAITDIGEEPTSWTNLTSGSSVTTPVNKLLTIKGAIATTAANKLVLTGTNIKVGGELNSTSRYQSLFEGCQAITDISNLKFPETTEVAYYAYNMFKDCINLVSANTTLSKTISNYCYFQMFYGCTNLKNAPILPATIATNECYRYMFMNCTSLTTPPELPATTLYYACYQYMFYGCTALTTAPDLPATTLANSCYGYMFTNCLKLIKAPDTLPAKIITDGAYRLMFQGCSILEKAPEILATSLSGGYNCQSMFRDCEKLKEGPESLMPTALTEECYGDMFNGCKLLKECPKMTINSTYTYCCRQMFRDCLSITIPVSNIFATSMYTDCFNAMFYNCSSISFSNSGTKYRVPKTGSTSSSAYSFMHEMFTGCSGGPLPTAPNTTYYFNGVMTTLKLEGTEFTVLNSLGRRIYYKLVNDPSDTWTPLGDTASQSFTTPVYIRGDFDGSKTAVETRSIVITATTPNVKLSGELLEESNYNYAFANSTGIMDTSDLVFPEDNPGTYTGMFYECTNLKVTVPVLPATKALENTYKSMFQNCTSLIQPPELSAMLLYSSACESMFEGCISLANPLNIRAHEISPYGCKNMFKDCTSLTHPGLIRLEMSTYPNYAFEGMYQNCTGITWGSSGVPYRVPIDNIHSPSTGTDTFKNMFAGCAGSLPGGTGTPSINTVYYYSGSMTTLEFEGANIEITNNTNLTLQYSSGTSSWLTLATGAKTPVANKLKIKGYFNTYSNTGLLVTGTNVKVSGMLQPRQNYQHLFFNSTGLIDASGLIFPTECGNYNNMFYKCTNLVVPPDKLSSKELFPYCYYHMFSTCSLLPTASELPATILAKHCYDAIFENCTSLIVAPELPATQLTDYCYYYMFVGCTALTTPPPIIPATKMKYYCCFAMFYKCYKLISTPELPATTLDICCYGYMFENCTSLRSLPALPAVSLPSSCYIGMFRGCTQMSIGSGSYYRVPYDLNTNTTSAGSGCTDSMLSNGSSAYTPSVNTVYYYYINLNPNITLTFEGTNTQIGNYTGTTLQYRINGGAWNYISHGSTTPIGSKIEIYGKVYSGAGYYYLKALGNNVKVSGVLPEGYDYNALFYNSTGLTDASGLVFPTNNIGRYNEMFYNCTSLTTPPTLPATTLKSYCYRYMFRNCTSLVIPPTLPATTLADGCYYRMFSGCSALTTPPVLPATKLKQSCYSYMFENCTSLISLPTLNIDELGEHCFNSMFTGCKGVIWSKDVSLTNYRINYSGSKYPTDWNVNMFKDNLGTIPEGNGYAKANKDYYFTTSPENLIRFDSIDGTGQVVMKNNSSGPITYYDENLNDFVLPKNQVTAYHKVIFINNTILNSNISITCSTNTMRVKGVLANQNYIDCFKGNYTLKDASGLIFPNTAYIYRDMFSGCTALTTAPELPATTLADFCYEYMFSGCTSLTTPPQLPATQLAVACYQSMFYGCTSLTTAPELPATTLAYTCYNHMFHGCTSLTTAPELPATQLVGYCYHSMFGGCTKLKSIAIFSNIINCMVEESCTFMYYGCNQISWNGGTIPFRVSALNKISGWNAFMFYNTTTGEEFKPEINTTYYYKIT